MYNLVQAVNGKNVIRSRSLIFNGDFGDPMIGFLVVLTFEGGQLVLVLYL